MSPRRPFSLLLLPVLLLGCDPELVSGFDYPLDDTLRFNHLQAVGTHNSYHVETPGVGIPEWAYTHPPLYEQLGEQGVRQFELDLYWNEETGGFDVYHVPALDETSNCHTAEACFFHQRLWSEANPAHHPMLTLIELKNGFEEETGAHRLAVLEEALLAAWPEDRLITPDDVQGDAASLKEALADDGWPTLGSLRGRALYVLHEGGGYRDVYTEGGTSTRGLLLFPDGRGDINAPYAAVHAVNDPIGSVETIRALVEANHLVRTRSDADSEGVLEGDTTRRDAAIASGAHFLSTDYPAPIDGLDYIVQLPGGTPSRCNPLTAPEACTAEAIENPAFINR